MIKIAIIGIGHVGYHHLRILSSDPRIKLIAISDIDENKSIYASNFNTKFYKNFQDLPDNLDAIIISTPTSSHYQIAKFFLNKKIHLFIEKPITNDILHAKELIELADKHNSIIQVGLIEKFNPAFISYKKFNKIPKFIYTMRTHPFINRCIDVDVVIDLMIHDLDLIINLLNNINISKISAKGFKTKTNTIDSAYAFISFENNCICHIQASRIDKESKRIMHIIQKDGIYSLNFANQNLSIFKLIKNEHGFVSFSNKILKKEKIELLPLELNSFINAIQTKNTNIINSAKNTFKSLELACKIREIIYNDYNK